MADKIPMLWPSLDSTVITSKYGYRTAPWSGFHTGIDIGAKLGSDVIAPANGTVIIVDENRWGNNTYGRYVRIDHGNNISTSFAHLNAFCVKVGDKVLAGQVIAKVGQSGNATGPHLHFEVRTSELYGEYGTVDPAEWVSPVIPSGININPKSGTAGYPTIVSPNSSSIPSDTSGYSPRLTQPSKDNKYYINTSYGGWNTAQLGNEINRPTAISVLPNSVGYAVGRFNEIGNYQTTKYFNYVTNAESFITKASESKLQISKSPSLGACAVWTNPTGVGHVAIVEEINGNTITTSESAWIGSPFTLKKRDNSNSNWSQGAEYQFLGFIKHPAVTDKTAYSSEGVSEDGWDSLNTSIEAKILAAQARQREIDAKTTSARQSFSSEVVNTKLGSISKIKGVNLLTVPTLVESPFIEAKIGKYTFGSYSKVETTNASTKITTRKINYPNFMDSLDITKVNGAVNQYVLHMKYQIQAGEDPNLIDKVLSTVSNTRKITLTYGDWSSPSFIYKNEEALITKVTSNVDFAHSCIVYTLYCTSTALSLRSKTYDFGTRTAKPSSVMIELLKNTSYGLMDIFYGFRNNTDAIYRMIATDDKVVSIKAQRNIDILSYLNYLVSCMINNSNNNSTIQNSMYSLIIKDDVGSELEGPYFKVIRTDSTNKTVSSSNMYEVDVGFPGNTLVTQFSLTNDNSWSILYNYSDEVSIDNYVYKIDNKGQMYVESSPNITTSNTYRETTAANKTWWTKMTQFPITATLQIKGLLRPAMLMEYIKINAYFYGQRHISSGLYVITKQEDRLDSSGYRTTLSLLRIAGDEDVLYSITQTDVDASTTQPTTSRQVSSNVTNTTRSTSSTSQRTSSSYSDNNRNAMLNAGSYVNNVNANNRSSDFQLLDGVVKKTQTNPIKTNSHVGAASSSSSATTLSSSNFNKSMVK